MRYIVVNHITSAPSHRKCRVPQGSVLGPLLLTMNTLPLGGVSQENNVSVHCFAGDSQLHDSAEQIHVLGLVRKLTFCIDKVDEWMLAKTLKANDDKTETIIPIGAYSKLKQVSV